MNRPWLLVLALLALIALAFAGDEIDVEADAADKANTLQCADALKSCQVTCVSDIFTPEDVATCRQGCIAGNEGCLQGHKIASRFTRMRAVRTRAAAKKAAEVAAAEA
jgi:hypothetical protein